MPVAIKVLMHDIVSLTTIDLRETPLGVVSVEQLTKAHRVLTRLRTLISMKKASQLELLDASNEFYTIIPTIFDARSPPRLLDNIGMIQVRLFVDSEEFRYFTSIENLSHDHEPNLSFSLFAFSTQDKMDMLRRWSEGLISKKKDPAWYIYSLLNTEIKVVPVDSVESNMIRKCIDTTIGTSDEDRLTHQRNAMCVSEIFSIKRKGESER